MNLQEFNQICPRLPNQDAISIFPVLLSAMIEFEINENILRQAAFIAQLAHESNEFKHTEENLNYSAQRLLAVWPKRFDALTAKSAEYNPEKIANIVYANRLGNGNYNTGDGYKFRGRGFIQLTGKDNYKQYGQLLKIDLLGQPSLACQVEVAARIAGCFWKMNKLNDLADTKEFDYITKKINGGLNGKVERDLYYHRGLKVLGATE